jgi:hypothetical protein
VTKQCIVNFFSQGRENYKEGTERMVTSALRQGYTGDVIIFSPDFTRNDVMETPNGLVKTIKGYPVTNAFGICKPHKEAPYMFKSHCFQYAKEQGYEEVLWCDSSTLFLKNPQHYFELAKEIGVITFDNQGCLESVFTSDDCLEQMGCSPEYANTFFQVEAFTILFNFNHQRANLVFEDYAHYCNDGICLLGASGSTRPEFKAHRHDQSVLSFILRKHYGIPINYGGWVVNEDFFKRMNDPNFKPTFGKIGIAYTPEY